MHQALAAVALRQSKLVYRGKINPVRRFQEIWLRSAVIVFRVRGSLLSYLRRKGKATSAGMGQT